MNLTLSFISFLYIHSRCHLNTELVSNIRTISSLTNLVMKLQREVKRANPEKSWTTSMSLRQNLVSTQQRWKIRKAFFCIFTWHSGYLLPFFFHFFFETLPLFFIFIFFFVNIKTEGHRVRQEVERWPPVAAAECQMKKSCLPPRQRFEYRAEGDYRRRNTER